jgi:hypothetical protein
MNKLIELFPKATLQGPLAIQHEFNIFTPDGRLFASSGGQSNNKRDTYSENVDNGKAIVHAINTYDAREAALLNAMEVLGRFANGSWDNDAGRAYEKIEAALAVKP